MTEGLHCGSCVARLEKLLKAQPGILEARVDLLARRATLETTDGQVPAGLVGTLAANGFSSEPWREASGNARSIEAAPIPWRPLAAMVGAGLAMYLHHGWPAFAAVAMVVIVPGGSLMLRGMAELSRLRPGMDGLVALSTATALGLGLAINLGVAPMEAGHADAAAATVAAVLAGRWLEAKARATSAAALAHLAVAHAGRAIRLDEADQEHDIPVDAVGAGDRLRVRAGARVPVDGEVQVGESEVDEALITGESLPVVKQKGDPVHGGSIARTGSFVMIATSTGADSAAGRLAALVDRARSAKPPLAALVDGLAARFAPLVVLVALGTIAIWWSLGEPWTGAWCAAAVLAAACPCALGLAIPAAVTAAVGRAAEFGVILATPRALGNAGDIDTVCLDKTGTLTTGQFRVVHVATADDREVVEVLGVAAAAEAGSEHPLALAIRIAAMERQINRPAGAFFRTLPGAGAEAEVDGAQVVLGSAAHFAERNIPVLPVRIPAGAVAVHVAVAGVAWGVVVLRDEIREESGAAIAALNARGLRVILLSGDLAAAAESVGGRLGIEEIVAQASPEQKLAHILGLRGEGRTVALVGDGINDAPALAAADLGIALGSGAAAAARAADAVVLADDLLAVVQLIDLARAARRTVRWNLIAAFGYNLLLLPIAAGVLIPFNGAPLHPGLAAAAMAGSSLTVLAFSLGLRRAGKRPDGRWRHLVAGLKAIGPRH